MAAIVAGGAGIVGGLYQIFHVSYEAQQNTADLARLRIDLDRAEGASRANDAAIKAMQRDLNEIETQFCAADDLRNLMHANDLRQFAMIYEKVFGSAYPVGNAYYPRVCNRQMAR